MTTPPCRWARGIQRVKKALQRLPPLGGEKKKSFLPGRVPETRFVKNTFYEAALL